MENSLFLYFPQNVDKRRDFQALADRETTVYKVVNEDFEGKSNAKITLLGAFYLNKSWPKVLR